MIDLACPNCSAPVGKVPTRKTRCRACGMFMYLRQIPGEPGKRLVTQAQAEEIERAWQAIGGWEPKEPVSRRADQLRQLREELENMRALGVAGVVVRASPGACLTCVQVVGFKASIDEAIASPAPNPDCKRWQRGAACCVFWAADVSDDDYGFRTTVRH